MPLASFAVIVSSCEAPAVCVEDPVTTKRDADPKTVTADDAVEAALVCALFEVVTVNVYDVFAVRPVTVQEVPVADDGVQVAPPGEAVTVELAMDEPPV